MSNEHIKLTYFGLRGRAEFIRYILHYAGVKFEDCRVEFEKDWPTVKDNFPKKQLPILEITKDGETTVLTESLAIGRYLARKYNLTGANERESALCDEFVDTLVEVAIAAGMTYYEPDAERKAKTLEKVQTQMFPVQLGYVERKLKENGGKHLVGKQWTWADFMLSCAVKMMHDYAGSITGNFHGDFPGLTALAKAVEEIPQIAAYIAVRPESNR